MNGFTHEELAIARDMAEKRAMRHVNNMWPDTPDNMEHRLREFSIRREIEFRKLTDQNWPKA